MCFIIIISMIFMLQASAKEVYQQETTIDLKTSCINDNTQSYCSSSALCNITLYYPDSTLITSNSPMDNHISYFNYTLNSTYTSQLGDYSGNILCVDGTNSQTQDFSFLITPSGKESTTGQGILYGGILLVTLILMVICIFAFFNIDGRNEIDFGGMIKVNFNKHLKYGVGFLAYLFLWATTYFSWLLAKYYLLLDFMAGLFRVFFMITTILLFPIFLIVFLFSLVKWLTDLKLQKLAKRGLKPR